MCAVAKMNVLEESIILERDAASLGTWFAEGLGGNWFHMPATLCRF